MLYAIKIAFKLETLHSSLITNGNFVDGGPALAADETDETVNGWRGYTSSAGGNITTDTSIYRSEGKSAKLTTDADGTYILISRDSNLRQLSTKSLI